MATIYAAIRVTHLPILRESADGRKVGTRTNPMWQKTECSCCGERVWHSPANSDGLAIICWECLGQRVEGRTIEQAKAEGWLDAR